MLIPRVEGFKILGTIFSSALFPNRAPAGHLTLTSYVGGERIPELASLPPEELFAITCEDLRVLLGVRGKPTFQHSVYYPKAIPQYVVGYGRYRNLMNEIETNAPGLFLAGTFSRRNFPKRSRLFPAAPWRTESQLLPGAPAPERWPLWGVSREQRRFAGQSWIA